MNRVYTGALARRRYIVGYAVAVLIGALLTAGVAFGAATISGRSIVSRSIPAAKIKRNALTGTEIRESRLGRVPTAASATNAQKLAGRSASTFMASSGTVTLTQLGSHAIAPIDASSLSSAAPYVGTLLLLNDADDGMPDSPTVTLPLPGPGPFPGVTATLESVSVCVPDAEGGSTWEAQLDIVEVGSDGGFSTTLRAGLAETGVTGCRTLTPSTPIEYSGTTTAALSVTVNIVEDNLATIGAWTSTWTLAPAG